MTTPDEPKMSQSSLDAVIAAYLLGVEAGQVPNRQELLVQHPEHADALHAFFADLDRMDRIGSPLRMAAGPDETSELESNGQTTVPMVRYFGDYELLEEIARGGMGIVYKARRRRSTGWSRSNDLARRVRHAQGRRPVPSRSRGRTNSTIPTSSRSTRSANTTVSSTSR